MTNRAQLRSPPAVSRRGARAAAEGATPSLSERLRRVDPDALAALAATTGVGPDQVARVLAGYAALLDQSDTAHAAPAPVLKVTAAARRAANGALVDAVLRDHDADVRAALAQGAQLDHQVDLATLPSGLFHDGLPKKCLVPVVTLAATLGKARALEVLAVGAIFDRSTFDRLGTLRRAGPRPLLAPPATLSAHPLVCAVVSGHPACVDVVVNALVARDVHGDSAESSGAALLDLRLRAGGSETVMAHAALHSDLDVTRAILRLPGARQAIEGQTLPTVRADLTARAALLSEDEEWGRVAPRHTPGAVEYDAMLHAIAGMPNVATPERLERLRPHWQALAAAFPKFLTSCSDGPPAHVLRLASAFLAEHVVADPAGWVHGALATCLNQGLIEGARHFAGEARAAGYDVALPSEIVVGSSCAGEVDPRAGLNRALAFQAAGGTPGATVGAALHKRQVGLLAEWNPASFNTLNDGLTALGYPEFGWTPKEAHEVVAAIGTRSSGRAERDAFREFEKREAVDAGVVDALEKKVASLPALVGDEATLQFVTGLRAKHPKASRVKRPRPAVGRAALTRAD